MLPTVFTLPIPFLGPTPIKGYGLMMMIGFLTAIYMCMRRAQKVRSDPDVVLNAGFLALLCGVFGARIFYVVHYWDTQFRGRGIWAAFDVRSGGLEFYGGFLAAVAAILLYLRIRGHSARLFLDIMAPGVMFGLAFGRLGCFLNGCCFGGICPDWVPFPLALTFPHGSPAMVHHLQTNRIALPREYLYVNSLGWVSPIHRDHLAMEPSEVFAPRERHREAQKELLKALEGLSPPETAKQVRQTWQQFAAQRERMPQGPLAGLDKERLKQEVAQLRALHKELSDQCAAFPEGNEVKQLINAEHQAWDARRKHFTELRDLLGDAKNPRPPASKLQAYQEEVRQFRSHRIWAAQPLGFLNAMILSGVLSLFFHRRRVHGAVFGLMFILYPITRFVLEMIRADNPLDSSGLTISQAISVGIIPIALVYMLVIYKLLPPQSPRAQIWTPPPDEPPSPPKEEGENSAKRSGQDRTESPSESSPSPAPDSDGNGHSGGTHASASVASEVKKSGRKGKPVVETVVVEPTGVSAGQGWHTAEAICAKCGTKLQPPQGMVYQRPGKRNGPQRAPGVAVIEHPDPNTRMDLLCEGCFDTLPPQDKSRGRRLAKKWWKTGKV